jgi:hypothetical protein
MKEGENRQIEEMKMILADDVFLATRAHDVWGANIEIGWLKKHKIVKQQSAFQENGFMTLEISHECALGLMGFFADSLITQFNAKDCNSDFFGTDLTKEQVKKVNLDNIYYTAPEANVQNYLTIFLKKNISVIEQELGSQFRVLNVRAWSAKPGTDFGPSAWHVDGGSKFLRKIMIYPLPPNKINGTLEFFDRHGHKNTIISDRPLAVVLDSSTLLHRGRPGDTENRPAIEITITPSVENDVTLIFAGQNARYLRSLPSAIVEQLNLNKFKKPTHNSLYKKIRARGGRLKRYLNDLPVKVKRTLLRRFRQYILLRSREDLLYPSTVVNVNIGGGPLFNRMGYVNLEGASSEANIYPFFFSESCVFPIPSQVVSCVYSSHCLEHLDDITVERVLDEARRVLNRQGKLVLKLPDFELTKGSWLNRDKKFFKKWDMENLIPLWDMAGIEDNISNRASMIFCGYWNKSYGDHFSRNIYFKNNAYHGPAKINKKDLEELLSFEGCHEIARRLVNYVKSTELEPIFNHQNAWSKNELEKLLNLKGFTVQSFEKEKICTKYQTIPDITKMKDISIYCEATLQELSKI